MRVDDSFACASLEHFGTFFSVYELRVFIILDHIELRMTEQVSINKVGYINTHIYTYMCVYYMPTCTYFLCLIWHEQAPRLGNSAL